MTRDLVSLCLRFVCTWFPKNLVEELDRAVASLDELKARNEELQQSEGDLKELCKNMEEENITLQEELEDSSNR